MDIRKLIEDVTRKSELRGHINAIKELLKDKTLPKEVVEALEMVDSHFKKTWEEMMGGGEPEDDNPATDLTPQPPSLNGKGEKKEAAQDFQTRDGKQFHKGDFFFTNTDNPSEWALLKSGTPGGEPDAVHTGAAAAALGPNPPHGKGVEIPDADKGAVKAAVLAAWKKAHPGWKADDENYPKWLGEAGGRTPTHEEGRTPSAPTEEEGSQIYESGFVRLVEKAIDANGGMRVKIIQPGWGSSGYYSPQVLKRAAADGVFGKGTKMYIDHPTPQEEADRPERSIRDLAAETTAEANWQDDPTNGPGLYAPAKVINPEFQEALGELAPHIGVSIRAMGNAEAGEAEGRKGPIVKEITNARSVDFVTETGAGGKIISMLEARRRTARPNPPAPFPKREGGGGELDTLRGDEIMGEKELTEANAQLTKTVTEQAAQLARLSEAMLLREAGEFAAVQLAEAQLPVITRNRLLKQLAANPPVKDGKLDKAAFTTQISEAVKEETAYLVEVSGSGRISGMGAPSNEPKPEEALATMKEAYVAMGYEEKVAERMAKGR